VENVFAVYHHTNALVWWYILMVVYLDGLNDAQKRAVLATEGPVVVLAGAGSGKTRVLATRVYHLIRNGVPADRILAVTFTNKAAREMRERVQHMLGLGTSEMRQGTARPPPLITTFHGLGRELLERYGSAIAVPRFFSIYDRNDSERAIATALKALDVGAKELSPRVVLARISRAKGEGLRVEEWQERSRRAGFAARVTAEAWQLYEKALRDEKALDFDDLIALPVRLLEEHEDIRALAQSRWQYLHIDEYQDTNALQERLAGLLAATHRNLFVVGDGDQSIYGWRGANMEHILQFEERYPGAQVIVLEQNYRATKNLVEAANAVIGRNTRRRERRSTTERASGELVRVHVAMSAEDEARWIAGRIRHFMQEGAAPEEIAILFRTNFQSRALEEGLLHASVPYRLLGVHFFARKEVKDVLAWVRLALDPSREADQMRAMQSPARGIGKTTIGKLVAGARDTLRASERERVEQFEAIVAELSRAADMLAPSDFVKLVIEKSGMRHALVDEGTEDDRERFENIEELVSVAARHDTLTNREDLPAGRQGIAAFLAEAALASDQDELDRPSKRAGRSERGGVTLMTVHAAKGLEFDTVFVSGMEEGLFPHAAALEDSERDEEEERRLFYVAMTRAKNRLILTLARVRKIYGSDYLTEPSSFLADIDPSFVRSDEDEEETIIEL